MVEETLKTCCRQLNESLNILPIADGQSEIETLGDLTSKCKALKDKLPIIGSTNDSGDTLKIIKHLDIALEKPKVTLLDHIKTLKVCTHKLYF